MARPILWRRRETASATTRVCSRPWEARKRPARSFVTSWFREWDIAAAGLGRTRSTHWERSTGGSLREQRRHGTWLGPAVRGRHLKFLPGAEPRQARHLDRLEAGRGDRALPATGRTDGRADRKLSSGCDGPAWSGFRGRAPAEPAAGLLF